MQKGKLFIIDDGSPEFKISVHLCIIIAFNNMLKCLEQPTLTLFLDTGEDKFVPRILILSLHIQTLTLSTFKFGIGFFNLVANDTVVPNCQINMLVTITKPNESQVGYDETAAISIITFSVFY